MFRLALTGKTVNDYNKSIASRLTKLAAAESTGLLPITGPSDGEVYLAGGAVVYARSSRTPSPPGEQPWTAGAHGATAPPAAGPHAAGRARPESPETDLSRSLGIAEATVDAALDLLSSRSACSRFRPAKVARPGSEAFRMPVTDLLAEISRRQRMLRQLDGLGADTEVIRSGSLELPRVQVTAPDWALLVRTRAGSTPRELAFDLGRSVFGTTAEVYRLVSLGLLSAAEEATPAHPAGPQVKSFLRALPEEKGAHPMPTMNQTAAKRRGGA